MDIYTQLRDRFYHVLFGLVSVRELQHWVNNRVKMMPHPPMWMLRLLQARDAQGALQVLGGELGPYVPMNYYSLLNSLQFRFKAEQVDIVGVAERLDEMIAYDPHDNVEIVNLSLQIGYIKDAVMDGNCSPEDARSEVLDAFEACEAAVLMTDEANELEEIE